MQCILIFDKVLLLLSRDKVQLVVCILERIRENEIHLEQYKKFFLEKEIDIYFDNFLCGLFLYYDSFFLWIISKLSIKETV